MSIGPCRATVWGSLELLRQQISAIQLLHESVRAHPWPFTTPFSSERFSSFIQSGSIHDWGFIKCPDVPCLSLNFQTVRYCRLYFAVLDIFMLQVTLLMALRVTVIHTDYFKTWKNSGVVIRWILQADWPLQSRGSEPALGYWWSSSGQCWPGPGPAGGW